MPFGLRNAPATFSQLVTRLLLGFEQFCVAYLDDILIFSETWTDHLKHLRLVFQRICNAKLTLKLSKCEFATAELDYLGHHVGLGKLLPREQKYLHYLIFHVLLTIKVYSDFSVLQVTFAGLYHIFQSCRMCCLIC